MSETAVLVFAKSPRAGEVKTRLVPGLSARQAAALYGRMLRRAMAAARDSGVGPLTLCAAPDTNCPELRALAAQHGAALTGQVGADLGARMHNALAHALERHPRALLMGSDCPSLGPEVVRKAHEVLASSEPVVLVPATDGGYVLVGLRRVCDAMFSEVPWGTSGVMGATRERLRGVGMAWRELLPLRDVDRIQDLDLLPSDF